MRDAKKKAIKYIILVIAIVGAVPTVRYGYIEYKKYTITKQWEKDIELFKQGIKQDIPLAIYGLGYAYHTGHGVEKNHQKARELYKQAADKGEALAQYNLGLMYHNGEGGEKDIEKAIFYYQKAAEQGSYIALMKLSLMYEAGNGVEKDFKKAKDLEKRALKDFGKSLSYRNQYKQIIKYQLGEF
jgi:TPR repeat protein